MHASVGMLCACVNLYDCPHCVGGFDVVVGFGMNLLPDDTFKIKNAHFEPLINRWLGQNVPPPFTVVLDAVKCDGCDITFNPTMDYKGRKSLCVECRNLSQFVVERT